jgi:hypothetical protein
MKWCRSSEHNVEETQKYFIRISSMYGAEKNVDGALEEKEMGILVENYVWKIRIIQIRRDKRGCPLYLGMMMLWTVQKQIRRRRIFGWKWLDMNVELTYKNIKIYT